jgi:predicted outer membrane protein
MRRVVLLAWLAAASTAQAADDRTLLNHCKALVAQASVSDNVEVEHCRQVIKEWTLRDSRMSVDEDGRPLR